MLIILIIQDQLSYDRFNKNKDRIFRIQSKDNLSKTGLNKYASTTWPLAKELKDNYPFTEDIVAINNNFHIEGFSNEKSLIVNGFFATPSFFKLFDFKLKNSLLSRPLEEPYSIVLTEELAEKFFGKEDPIGKTIIFERYGNFKVTGVIPYMKQKSHFQFEALISSSTIPSLEKEKKIEEITNNWEDFNSSYIYILINKTSSQKDLVTALEKISSQKYPENKKVNISFYITALSKIVPGPILSNEIGVFLPAVFVIFFGGLAIVIMLSAAFNYSNLSIARSLTRAKEYGIRKSYGASGSQLIFQVLTEAISFSLISLLFAFILLQLFIPPFTGMKFMKDLNINPHQNLISLLIYFVFACLTGFFAGIIPAVYVSSLNPLNVFKVSSNIRFGKRITLRKILLIIQYIISIVLIISIILIYRQMDFMLNSKLGFDKTAIYNIQLKGQPFSKIKDRYSQLSEITSISAESHIPGIGSTMSTHIKIRPEEESYDADYFSVDQNYLGTMGIRLLAGENFSKDPVANKNSIIINKKAVEYFKFHSNQDAIGKEVYLNDSVLVNIVGVIEDYKYAALPLPLNPLIIRVNPVQFRFAVLRIVTNDRNALINKIKDVWRSIDPYHEIEGSFLDDQIKAFYSMFSDVLYTIVFITALAIIIACLGLLGMATYNIETSLKEIGIRKVFGSQSQGIVLKVGRSFIIILVISSIIGVPIAYSINMMWLNFIAFHVQFGVGNILIGIFIVFIISILTVLYQTLKAATLNPVDILKHE